MMPLIIFDVIVNVRPITSGAFLQNLTTSLGIFDGPLYHASAK